MSKTLLFALGLAVVLASRAAGQSSSLYLPDADATAAAQAGTENRLAPSIAAASWTAVRAPEPRVFAVHDLVTIIVRESTESESDATLKTKKDANFDGQVSAFPEVFLLDAAAGAVLGDRLSERPRVGMRFRRDFNGDGEYSRSDTFTSRVTARIIDIKPNGTIVLEARKHIRSDRESMTMVISGTCRKEDISADNTVLSTQLYDLHLTKEHTGELRKASKKGWLTKVFEAVFAF